MKPRTILLSLFALSIIISGCPSSNEIPFSEKSTADRLDPALLGRWKNYLVEVEANEVVISKGKAANTYKILITETGSEFDANSKLYTGWITTIKGTRYLVLQAVLDSGPSDEYYLYTVELNGNKLISYDVYFDDVEAENAKTVKQFQQMVLENSRSEDFLKGEIEWWKK